MERAYHVFAIVKKHEIGESQWRIDVLANSSKEAKEKARALWTGDAHLFRMKAKGSTGGVHLKTWTKIAYWKGSSFYEGKWVTIPVAGEEV